MVPQVQAPGKGGQSIDVSIAEFGQLNLRHFDLQREYRGCMTRLSSETFKSITDALGFTARFDDPGVRVAFMDLYRTEAHFVLEIERNTKPQDVGVRYTRDRWSLQDVLGKGSDGLRSLIRTDYHARVMPEESASAVATLLNIPAGTVGSFYVRINFKDQTCGLICEETLAENMPPGAFKTFTLPAPNTVAHEIDNAAQTDQSAEKINIEQHETKKGFKGNIAMANQENTWIVERKTANEEEAALAEQNAASVPSGDASPAESATAASPADQAQTATATSEPAAATSDAHPGSPDSTASASSDASSEVGESSLAAQYKATEETLAQATAAVAKPVETKPAAEIAPTRDGTYVSSPPAVKPIVIPSRTAEPTANAGSHQKSAASRPEAKSNYDKSSDRDRPSDRERPSDRVLERSNNNSSSTVRRDNTEIQPKYATYSKSEVDYMLKQQAESILSALSGKIGQQQRAFQETITAQEKSFSKLYDSFVTQFESSKAKLEGTAKSAHENTSGELDSFKKTLSKELEQHRTLINRTVLPVQKALEDRPLKAPKEQAKQPAQTVVVKGGSPLHGKMLAATLVAAALSLFISIANFLTVAEIKTGLADLTKASQPAHK